VTRKARSPDQFWLVFIQQPWEQFNIRVYDNEYDEFFDYTTQVILTPSMIEIDGHRAYGDNYYFYKKMHLIKLDNNDKKGFIRRIYAYYKLNKD
jgi:hypothetical protein